MTNIPALNALYFLETAPDRAIRFRIITEKNTPRVIAESAFLPQTPPTGSHDLNWSHLTFKQSEKQWFMVQDHQGKKHLFYLTTDGMLYHFSHRFLNNEFLLAQEKLNLTGASSGYWLQTRFEHENLLNVDLERILEFDQNHSAPRDEWLPPRPDAHEIIDYFNQQAALNPSVNRSPPNTAESEEEKPMADLTVEHQSTLEKKLGKTLAYMVGFYAGPESDLFHEFMSQDELPETIKFFYLEKAISARTPIFYRYLDTLSDKALLKTLVTIHHLVFNTVLHYKKHVDYGQENLVKAIDLYVVREFSKEDKEHIHMLIQEHMKAYWSQLLSEFRLQNGPTDEKIFENFILNQRFDVTWRGDENNAGLENLEENDSLVSFEVQEDYNYYDVEDENENPTEDLYLSPLERQIQHIDRQGQNVSDVLNKTKAALFFRWEQHKQQGRTLLHDGVLFLNENQQDCLEEIDRLIAEGQDPNAQDKKGLSPLHLAIQKGKISFSEKLLPHCNIFLMDKRGHNHIISAMIRLHKDHQIEKKVKQKILESQFLIQTICAIINKQEKCHPEILHFLFSMKQEALIDQVLLKNPELNVNQKNSKGNTFLHLLVQSKMKNTVEKFLKQCPQLNVFIQNNKKKTPLGLAIAYSQKDIFLLLAKHADLSPIQLALDAKKLVWVQELIQSNQYQTNMPIPHHGTLLHWAIKEKNQNISNLIISAWIEQGLPFNTCDKDGRTALHWAVEAEWWDVVKVLLSHKADPKTTDHHGLSSMDIAAQQGKFASQRLKNLISIVQKEQMKDHQTPFKPLLTYYGSKQNKGKPSINFETQSKWLSHTVRSAKM